eukprot:8570815-Heterocapsa_arctica.AAC.1
MLLPSEAAAATGDFKSPACGHMTLPPVTRSEDDGGGPPPPPPPDDKRNLDKMDDDDYDRRNQKIDE